VGEVHGSDEYIRHDLHLALVAEAYEACAQKVLTEQAWKFYSYAERERLAERVRRGTPADAQTAREARDKRVKKEGLREAAVICNQSYGGSIGDVHKAILALIEKDKTDE